MKKMKFKTTGYVSQPKDELVIEIISLLSKKVLLVEGKTITLQNYQGVAQTADGEHQKISLAIAREKLVLEVGKKYLMRGYVTSRKSKDTRDLRTYYNLRGVIEVVKEVK